MMRSRVCYIIATLTCCSGLLIVAPARGEFRRPHYTEEDLRSVAAEGLSKCATANSYDILARTLPVSSPYQRQHIILAMGRAGDKRAIPLIREVLLDSGSVKLHDRKPGGSRGKGDWDRVEVPMHETCVAALEKLGHTEWLPDLLEQIRRENPDKTREARLAVLVDRYWSAGAWGIRHRICEDPDVLRVLRKGILNEDLSPYDRNRVADAGLKFRIKELASCGAVYLNDRKQRGLPLDPDKLPAEERATGRLIRNALRLVLLQPTRAELGLLRDCAEIASLRAYLPAESLVSSGDLELFKFAVECVPRGRFDYSYGYSWMEHMRPEYADFLLEQIGQERWSEEERDSLAMLLAKIGDRRVVPLVQERIVDGKLSSSIYRAITYLPDARLVGPLLDAREKEDARPDPKGNLRWPLLPVLVTLNDKRAIPIIMSPLQNRSRSGLGGKMVVCERTNQVPATSKSPRDMYRPSAPRRPQVYRYTSARYLRQLGATQVIPELRTMVEQLFGEGRCSDQGCRDAGKQALAALGALGAPDTVELAERAYPVIPRGALWVLVEIDSPEAWQALKRVCSGEDWQAAVLLHERGDDSGVQRVIAAAKKQARSGKRGGHIDALEDLVNAIHHQEATRALVDIVSRPGYFKSWSDAFRLGGYTRMPEVVPALITAYQNADDNWDRAEFLGAMGRNGGPAAEQFLCKVLVSQ